MALTPEQKAVLRLRMQSDPEFRSRALQRLSASGYDTSKHGQQERIRIGVDYVPPEPQPAPVDTRPGYHDPSMRFIPVAPAAAESTARPTAPPAPRRSLMDIVGEQASQFGQQYKTKTEELNEGLQDLLGGLVRGEGAPIGEAFRGVKSLGYDVPETPAGRFGGTLGGLIPFLIGGRTVGLAPGFRGMKAIADLAAREAAENPTLGRLALAAVKKGAEGAARFSTSEAIRDVAEQVTEGQGYSPRRTLERASGTAQMIGPLEAAGVFGGGLPLKRQLAGQTATLAAQQAVSGHDMVSPESIALYALPLFMRAPALAGRFMEGIKSRGFKLPANPTAENVAADPAVREPEIAEAVGRQLPPEVRASLTDYLRGSEEPTYGPESKTMPRPGVRRPLLPQLQGERGYELPPDVRPSILDIAKRRQPSAESPVPIATQPEVAPSRLKFSSLSPRTQKFIKQGLADKNGGLRSDTAADTPERAVADEAVSYLRSIGVNSYVYPVEGTNKYKVTIEPSKSSATIPVPAPEVPKQPQKLAGKQVDTYVPQELSNFAVDKLYKTHARLWKAIFPAALTVTNRQHLSLSSIALAEDPINTILKFSKKSAPPDAIEQFVEASRSLWAHTIRYGEGRFASQRSAGGQVEPEVRNAVVAFNEVGVGTLGSGWGRRGSWMSFSGMIPQTLLVKLRTSGLPFSFGGSYDPDVVSHIDLDIKGMSMSEIRGSWDRLANLATEWGQEQAGIVPIRRLGGESGDLLSVLKNYKYKNLGTSPTAAAVPVPAPEVPKQPPAGAVGERTYGRATDKSVRDLKQSAEVKNGAIRVDSYVGNKRAGSFGIALIDWPKDPTEQTAFLRRHPSNANVEEAPGGFGQAQRIIESQQKAINRALGIVGAEASAAWPVNESGLVLLGEKPRVFGTEGLARAFVAARTRAEGGEWVPEQAGGKWNVRKVGDSGAGTLPPRTADTMSDAIAMSSPSGKVSGRAQAAAQNRLRESLFGEGGLQRPKTPQPEGTEKAELLRQQATELRNLADRGMRPKVHVREAERLEAEADAIAAKYGKGAMEAAGKAPANEVIEQDISRGIDLAKKTKINVGTMSEHLVPPERVYEYGGIIFGETNQHLGGGNFRIIKRWNAEDNEWDYVSGARTQSGLRPYSKNELDRIIENIAQEKNGIKVPEAKKEPTDFVYETDVMGANRLRRTINGAIERLVPQNVKGKTVRVWNKIIADKVAQLGGIPIDAQTGQPYPDLAAKYGKGATAPTEGTPAAPQAEFAHYQESYEGKGKDLTYAAPEAKFNITDKNHPRFGSTLNAQELASLGIRVPESPVVPPDMAAKVGAKVEVPGLKVPESAPVPLAKARRLAKTTEQATELGSEGDLEYLKGRLRDLRSAEQKLYRANRVYKNTTKWSQELKSVRSQLEEVKKLMRKSSEEFRAKEQSTFEKRSAAAKATMAKRDTLLKMPLARRKALVENAQGYARVEIQRLRKEGLVSPEEEASWTVRLESAKNDVETVEIATEISRLDPSSKVVERTPAEEAEGRALEEEGRAIDEIFLGPRGARGGLDLTNPQAGFARVGREKPSSDDPRDGASALKDAPDIRVIRDLADVGLMRHIGSPSNVLGAIPGQRQPFGPTAAKAERMMLLAERDISVEIGRRGERGAANLHKISKKFYGKDGAKLYDYIKNPERDAELDPRSLEVVQDFRKMFAEDKEVVLKYKRDKIRSAVFDEINKEWRAGRGLKGARLTAEQKAERDGVIEAELANRIPAWGVENYLPEMHLGKRQVFFKIGTDPETGHDTYSFIGTGETAFEAKAIALEHYYKNKALGATPESYVIKGRRFLLPDVVRISRPRLFRVVNEISKRSDAELTPEAVREFLLGTIGAKESKQKFAGFLQHRRGYEGFSKDLPLVLSLYNSSFARWRHLSGLSAKIEPAVRQMKAAGQENLANYVEGTFKHLWGQAPSALSRSFDATLQKIPVIRDSVSPGFLDRWSSALKGLNTTLFLKINPRFHLLNRLQTFQTLLVTPQEWIEGRRLYMSKPGKELLSRFGVKYLTGGKLLEGSKVRTSPKVRERMRGAAPETFNQEVAWATFFAKGKKLGMTDEAANDYAFLKGNVESQFAHLRSDMPEMLRGPVTSVIFQWKRYSIKTLELGANKLRNEEIGGFSQWLGAQIFLSGSRLAIKAATFGTGAYLTYKMYRAIKDEYGEVVADGIMWGLPTLLGLDMSYSFQLLDIPYGDSVQEKVGNLLLSPAGTTAVSVAASAFDTKGGEPSALKRAVGALGQRVPGLRWIDALRAMSDREASGEYNFRDPAGRLRFKGDLKDVVVKALGGRTVTEAQTELFCDALMSVYEKRDAALDAVVNDPASSAVLEWNEAWPEYPISQKEIDNRSERRGATSELDRTERVLKQMPKAMKGEGLFAPEGAPESPPALPPLPKRKPPPRLPPRPSR